MADKVDQMDELIKRAESLQPFLNGADISKATEIIEQGELVGGELLGIENHYVRDLRKLGTQLVIIQNEASFSAMDTWGLLVRDLPITLKSMKQLAFFLTRRQDNRALEELKVLIADVSMLGNANDSNKAEYFRRLALNLSEVLFGAHNTYAEKLEAFSLPPVTSAMLPAGVFDAYMRGRGKLQEIVFAMQRDIERAQPNLSAQVAESRTGSTTYQKGQKVKRDQVFISYSHRDKRWLDMLETFLKPYTRKQVIDVWSDTRIKGGDIWREEIKRALERAKVAVLLVTSNFVASDFIQDEELPSVLEAAQNEGLRILWIAVSPSGYDETPIAKYQALNTPSKPLSALKGASRDNELVRICREIARVGKPDTNAPDQSIAPMLTPRQLEVLQLLDDDLNNLQIASELQMSPATVRSHVRQICNKLGVESRHEAVKVAKRLKLL